MLVTTLKYLMNTPDVIHLINTDLIGETQLNFFLVNLILESSSLLGAKPFHVICQQEYQS